MNNDPYDMEDIVMPLHEYINHPVTRDIVHNGATFQVLHCALYFRLLLGYFIRYGVLKNKL